MTLMMQEDIRPDAISSRTIDRDNRSENEMTKRNVCAVCGTAPGYEHSFMLHPFQPK